MLAVYPIALPVGTVPTWLIVKIAVIDKLPTVTIISFMLAGAPKFSPRILISFPTT